jgi:tetratricopeptide (TPR) repeat protein
MLNLRLTPDRTAALAKGRTADPEAHQLYMEGRGALRQALTVATLDEAIALFDRAIAADSAFPLAYAGLGEAYWQKYRQTDDAAWVETALLSSRQALALDSTLAPVWVTLGIIRSGQRHDDAAIAAFQRALALDAGYADTYRHLATVYRRRGEDDRAEATYRQAITRQPEYWKGYNALGVFYYFRGRYADAIAQYEHGLRLAPANASLLNNIAVAYWQLERIDQAMGIFERILALDSTRVSVQSNLATAYFYQGRYDDAVRLYARATQQHPKDHSLAGALADAQTWSSDHAPAAPAAYRRAITLAREHTSFRGQDPLIVGSIAQYYARLGDRDSAQVWLQELEPLIADTAAVDAVYAFGVGELYESLGRRQRALPWIQRALAQGYGWIPLQYSPWLADLRSDPTIRRLLANR